MKEAIAFAKKSLSSEDVPIGCVIVKNNKNNPSSKLK